MQHLHIEVKDNAQVFKYSQGDKPYTGEVLTYKSYYNKRA